MFSPWKDDTGVKTDSHTFAAKDKAWVVPTGQDTQTRWVELEPVASR